VTPASLPAASATAASSGLTKSAVRCVIVRQLPEGSASRSVRTIPCGLSPSVRKCRTAISMRATGRPRSRVARSLGSLRILSGSRRSPWMNAVEPPGLLVIRARACASTIGSLSPSKTLLSGAVAWATSWVLSAVGMPDPMSRNCRMPASVAR
jgi:hypothetical protein